MKRFFSRQLMSQQGFSLIEIIISLGIFVVFVAALSTMVNGGFVALLRGGEQTEAYALAQEAFEAVRSIRDRSWNDLQYITAKLDFVNGQWELVSAVNEVIDGKYTREILIDNACRDGSNALVECPGTYTDVQTKKILVRVSWAAANGITQQIEQITYVSNWEYGLWQQTDWSGGSGQSMWSNTTRYDTDNASVNVGTSGQVSLAQAPQGSWELTDRQEVTHTTDTDFELGAFTGTVVDGVGEPAQIVLDTETIWSEHAQSGIISNKHLEAVFALSEQEVWAGGNNGEILFFNGSTWSSDILPSAGHIRSIFALSGANIWVSGHGGKVWNYDGNSWQLNVDTGNEEWNGLTMISATDGWIGGSGGSLGHYDGSTWNISSIPSPDDINDFAALASDDVWAVGNNGKIWHYNGSSWQLNATISGTNWNDIVMVSSTQGWVVGSGGLSAYYNGSIWTTFVVDSTADISGVEVLRPDSVWAVGNNGRIWEYDGTSWYLHTNSGGDHLNAITIDSALYMWAVGNNGYIMQGLGNYIDSGSYVSTVIDSSEASSTWDYVTWTENLPTNSQLTVAIRTGETATPDGTWSTWSNEYVLGDSMAIQNGRYLQYRISLTRGDSVIETPTLYDITFIYNAATIEDLYGTDFVSGNDMWAVGDSGKILQYNGTSWSEFVDTGTQSWHSISMVDANFGWAVSTNGDVAMYNGTSWLVSAIVDTAPIYGVDALSRTEAYAVGGQGKIWFYNGTYWVSTDTGAQQWNAVSMLDDETGWAVGSNGEIAQYDEGTWVTNITLSGSSLQSVFTLSENNAWAVGANGEIWHYNGSTWSLHTDTGNQLWRDISFVDASQGWIVGDMGEIYEWDGSTWDVFSSPTSRDLHGIIATTNGGAIVGGVGQILIMPGGGNFYPLGTIQSSAYFVGSTGSLDTLEWDEQVATCTPLCSIQLQVRAADDVSGSPGTWSDWYGVSGAGTYYTDSVGNLLPISFNDKEWVQYRAELISDGSVTPILEEIRIKY